jgi:hypothetical protein
MDGSHVRFVTFCRDGVSEEAANIHVSSVGDGLESRKLTVLLTGGGWGDRGRRRLRGVSEGGRGEFTLRGEG